MRTFARGGLVFDVRDEGPQDGIPVVLLHGFPQDSTAWDAVVPQLHEVGFRTLAPNQRGYSPRARPSSVASYRTRETAEDVIALLDAAKVEKAHVVGHNWGGAVAWAVASEWPDRVLTLTSVSTPHPAAMRSVMLSSTQAFKSWYMGLFQIPRVSEFLFSPGGPAWQAVTSGLPTHQAHHYSQRMESPGALSAALNWYRVLPREILIPSMKVGEILAPTLFVWGDQDPSFGRAATEKTAEFVTGKYLFTILPGVGHWVPETAPELLAQAVLAHIQRTEI
ncbi:MAG: alpha/beta hydrolase [Candidatus Nanopelagicales bacterium]|nr:alpha/beta hydrolase [Candidatus Nanopelagicales bacterium]MDZ4250384.1 alpha/beta hydrolase [Candidatus Nanopelagicales bacterium]